MYKLLNEFPGEDFPPMQRPPESIAQYFTEWLDGDRYPIWSFWENVKTWWALREFPNVKLLHYNKLKEEMSGEIRKIAAFLEISIDENKWEEILHHCSFDYMKQNAGPVAPLEGEMWKGEAKTFMYKGTNNRWKDQLPLAESQRYESLAKKRLGEECAHWLATGNFK